MHARAPEVAHARRIMKPCPGGLTHPRTEALVRYVRHEIGDRRRKLALEERGTTQVTRSIRDRQGAEHRAIEAAAQQLTRYHPALGKEHCPRCFAFEGREGGGHCRS